MKIGNKEYQPPKEWKMLFCSKCGRNDLLRDLKEKHWAYSKLCKGELTTIVYVESAAALNEAEKLRAEKAELQKSAHKASELIFDAAQAIEQVCLCQATEQINKPLMEAIEVLKSMSEKIIECYRYAVFSSADVMLESTLAYSRQSAIKEFLGKRPETVWKDYKKRGFYTARIQMIWQTPKN